MRTDKNNKRNISIKTIICYGIYRLIGKHLPGSTCAIIGKCCCKFRYFLCRNIFEYCGKNVTIERGVDFGYGYRIRIGNNSGMGTNARIPDGVHIGANVMMGPNCYILVRNHKFDRVDIPMINQGYQDYKYPIIKDDVWIGRNVTILPGRIIEKGTVVAANTVLTKDFPEYSIVGGNPSRLIRSRLDTTLVNSIDEKISNNN